MVSQMAMEDIDDLAEAGVTVTPAEIVMLNALAIRAERGPDSPILFAAPRRVSVGSVTLHEPTLQSENWMTTVGSEIAADSATYWSLELFAAAHARDAGYFDRLPDDSKKIKKVVSKWFSGVSATRSELTAALAYVRFGPDYGTDEIGVLSDTDKEALKGRNNHAEELLTEALGARLGLAPSELGTMTESRIGRAVLLAFRSDGAEIHDESKDALADYFRTLDKIKERVPENGR